MLLRKKPRPLDDVSTDAMHTSTAAPILVAMASLTAFFFIVLLRRSRAQRPAPPTPTMRIQYSRRHTTLSARQYLPSAAAPKPTPLVSMKGTQPVATMTNAAETSPTSVTDTVVSRPVPVEEPPSPPASLPPAPPSLVPRPDFFTAKEAAVAERLYADRGGPPSDRPDALLICDRPDAKTWRRKATSKPAWSKGKLDEYESYMWLPVHPETLLAMLCDVRERVQWDNTTVSMEVVSTTPPCPLRRLHEQDGDEMTLLWQLAVTWPLANREYVLHRRVCVFREQDGGAGAKGDRVVYSKVDGGDDGPESFRLVPTVTPKARRVPEHLNICSIYADPIRGGTCYRAFVIEDPMMTLPKWLLGWLLDKLVPSSLAAMTKTAVAYEKRLLAAKGQQQQGQLMEDAAS